MSSETPALASSAGLSWRWVVDAGVDIARHFQVKQICTMLRVVKRVSHGLVNGHGGGFGGGVWHVASVHSEGFDFHGFR